jgi:uncharacterized membrane protein
MLKRIGVAGILMLAFFGLADSAYLAEHEISGTPLLCSIQNLSGCNVVAASQYSHLFGQPLAVYGVFFYGIFFILAALELVLFDRFLRRVLQGISLIGVIASLYFTLIQIFVIGAFCIYCFASALTALFIFIFATLIEPIRRPRRPSTPPSSGTTKGTAHLRMPPAI